MTGAVRLSTGSRVLALSGWLALAATWLPSQMILRPLSLAAFVLWCPGAALMQRWPAVDRLERAVVTVAMSIGVSVIIAESQAYAGLWDARGTVAILALLTTCAVVMGRSRPRGEPA